MEKSLKETENVKLKLFCCKECNKTFKSEHSYLKHDQRHKKNHSNENSSGKTSAELKEDNVTTKNKHGKKYECETCKKQFRFKNSLKKHETRHQYNGFACRNCGETFSSAKLREKHRENVHKTWQCFICHIRFESENKYLSHVETLHEGRNRDLAVCNVCGKQFKSKSQLTPHLESKCGTVKRFKCDICDALLMTTGALHNHRLRHAGAHAHMCRFCAKTFVSAGQLTVHERVHTQEKAFVCEICNKGFCHRQSLITHSTLHTGIKPFQCEGCSKAFSCIGNLLKHRRTHADTCGALPLTTHRVKNPETRAKVQANTPNGIKLRQNKKKSILLNRSEEVSCKDEVCTENNAETTKENATSETVQKEPCEFIKVADLKLDEDKEKNSIPPDSDINPIDDICSTKKDIKKNENINGLNLAERREMALNEIKDPKKENILESESSSTLVCKQDATKHSNSIKYEKSDDDMEKENRMGSENNLALTCQEENIIKGTERCTENPVKLESVTEIKNEISDDYEMDRISNFDDDHHDDNFSEDETFKLVESKPKSKKTKRKTTKPRTKRKSKENISKLIDEESFRNERKTGKGDDMACKICGLVFNRVAWLVRHEATHEKRPLEPNESTCFKCNCCNESFQTRDECVTHQEKLHRNELGCEICNKMFANRDSRRTHINYYHKGIPRRAYVYVCDKCGKTFKQKNALSAHEISNCGVSGKVFKCEVCEKQFSNIYSRRAHMKIHEGDKGQICKFCGKSFVWKGQLKVHERSHTGEKPYKCQFCPKAFAHRESLITHNSIHTGFKPHVCEGCGSRFSCIGNLFKHRRTHSSVCSMSVSKEEAISKKKHKVQVNMQGVKLKNSSQQKSAKGEENKNDVSVS